MGVMANEPSMEDILSSIKRIIADGSDRPGKASRRRGTAEPVEPDPVEDDLADIDAPEAPYADEEEASEPAVLELSDYAMDAEALEAAPVEAASIEPTPVETPLEDSVTAAHPAPSEAAREPATAPIISDVSAQAARASLVQLSSMLVKPREGSPDTLEGLVRDMLRPMLKDWLEANLPDMVEGLVKKEIDRIVGRLG